MESILFATPLRVRKSYISPNRIRTDFEDLQKNDVLCAIFARMKYAEFPDKIPSDAKGRAAYYKKFFNTQYGASKESVYISKKEKALSSSKNKKLFQNWKLNSKK